MEVGSLGGKFEGFAVSVEGGGAGGRDVVARTGSSMGRWFGWGWLGVVAMGRRFFRR